MTRQDDEKTHIPRRMNIIFLIVFLFFAALILRLALVQLVHGEEYLHESELLSTKTLPISAPRGKILDKNGEVIVSNQVVFTVTFLANNNDEKLEESVAQKLSTLLDGMSKEEVLKAMRSGLPRYIPRRIKVGIEKHEMMRIAERLQELPGVDVIEEPLRKIRSDVHGGAVATHMIGYINAISDRVDDYLAKGYLASDRVGMLGLEKYYEDQLRGTNGEMEVKVNRAMETIEKRMKVAPVPGNDLVLTLDLQFQDKVEQILAESIEQIQKDPKRPRPLVTSASAVLINPKTGAVLAMANFPDYDLNLQYSPNRGKIYNEKIANRESNLAANAPYPIGSTAKPAAAMMGLQEGLITANSTIFDTGGMYVGNTFMKNWRAGGHGRVNVFKALQVSNNTFFYDLALKLGNYPQSKTAYKKKFSTVDYYFNQFGLGVKTGIDLPYESSGWESSHYQLGNLAHALIGQHDLYTPLQLAQYVSTIANNGYRMRPYLVQEIREGTDRPEERGRVLMKREPEVLNKINIKPEYIKIVQQGMRMVTQQGGTGYYAFLNTPYTVAAKTGTAQSNRNGHDHSIIIAYAPYEDPQVALAVIVPYGGSGSDASAPIARKLLDAYFGVTPVQNGK